MTEPAPGVFFIHVMKTGGTSLSRALERHVGAAAMYPHCRPDRRTAKASIDELLQLDAEQRERLRAISVHMPAWVAEAAAPDFLSVTILRDPISRTLSWLRTTSRHADAPDDLTEIYDDPAVRARLANYQTRLFALESTDRALSLDPSDIENALQTASAAEQAQFHDELRSAMRLSNPHANPLTEDDYARAVARLEQVDVVGTVDDLGAVTREIARRTGWDLATPSRQNVSERRTAASPELVDRIAADCPFDARLYARAQELAPC